MCKKNEKLCLLRINTNREKIKMNDLNAKNLRAANTFAIMHLIWYLIMIAALPIVLLFGWGKFYALTTVVVILFAWAICGGCPLRHWENDFRKKMDPPTDYPGTFMSHYSQKILRLKMSPMFSKIFNVVFLLAILFLAIISFLV